MENGLKLKFSRRCVLRNKSQILGISNVVDVAAYSKVQSAGVKQTLIREVHKAMLGVNLFVKAANSTSALMRRV